VGSLVAISILATAIKAAIYQGRYRASTLARLPDRSTRPIELAYFRRAFAFFALGFTGLLQSRIDLYLVGLFLPKSMVGQYQVLMNFLLYLQALSNFVLGPFVKNLYRLSYRSILSLSLRLLALGALLCPLGLLLIDVVLRVYYGFDLPPIFFGLGGAVALPIYFYLPIIYALYKGGLAGRVVGINVLGIATSAAISLLLLPTLGLLGAVTGAAAAQLLMLLAYVWRSRELREGHALTVPELS
jgi:O-antigen/teichoic acid export membrane protein